MISEPDNKHEKHAKLQRASYGEWGRCELSILGSDCGSITQLAQNIIQGLPQYKVVYIDAVHNNAKSAPADVSTGSNMTHIECWSRTAFARLDITTLPDAFRKRTIFNDFDLILVNGNHFAASGQIAILDEKKPLERKADAVTDVKLILAKGNASQIPDVLKHKAPELSSLGVNSLYDTEGILRSVKHFIRQKSSFVNGLVLSGGKSIRMGQDKGELVYHGTSQREHVYNLLQGICAETFISCSEEQAPHLQQLPLIKDAFLDLGPIGGILSAFQKHPDKAWFTVACDLPFLQETHLRSLMQNRNQSKMATAYLDAEGKFPEPLITIWEPRAYPVLLQFLAQGYSCPRKVLINSDIEIIPAPGSSSFTNVNTKEEYQEALLHLQSTT